jgi:serine/threonine-protein kinase RsbW
LPDIKSRSCAITVTVKAELDQIPQIKESIAEIMKESGFGQRKVLEVQLAVEEACTNIVHYAYEDKEGLIYVSARVKKDRLEIMIEDNGPPFDPTEHMTLHRTTHDDIESPVGGWGIGLIRMLMDEITYERWPGKNILYLVKKKKQRAK